MKEIRMRNHISSLFSLSLSLYCKLHFSVLKIKKKFRKLQNEKKNAQSRRIKKGKRNAFTAHREVTGNVVVEREIFVTFFQDMKDIHHYGIGGVLWPLLVSGIIIVPFHACAHLFCECVCFNRHHIVEFST